MTKISIKSNNIVKLILLLLVVNIYYLSASSSLSQESRNLSSEEVIANEPKARAILEDILSNGSAIINDFSTTKSYKLNLLSELLGKHSNAKDIKRLLLGPYLRKMTVNQQQQYDSIIKDFLATSLSLKLLFLQDASYKIVNYRQVQNDLHYDVEITANNSQTPVNVVISHITEPSPKITDVVISGASLLVAQRAEFSSILRRGGIDELIKLLQNFTAKYKK